jgi:hypothetical protein
VVLGDEKRGKKCSIAVQCSTGLEELWKGGEASCRRFLADKNYLKHQAFGALFRGTESCGFAFVDRDEDQLSKRPPVVCLQFTDSQALGKALLALKDPRGLQFILVDTPVFAYEPILKELKAMTTLPLQEVLLNPSGLHSGMNDFEPVEALQAFVSELCSTTATEDGIRLKGTEVRLDTSQADSLVDGITKQVSLIQGPPGRPHQSYAQ